MHFRFISIRSRSNSRISCMRKSLSGTIDYIEMPSRNLAETKRVFSALFGWSFVDYGPDYSSFDDGRMAGGFFTSEKLRAWTPGVRLSFFIFLNWKKSRLKSRNSAEKSRVRFLNFPADGAFIFANPAAASSPSGPRNSNCRSFLQLLLLRLLIIIGNALETRVFYSCRRLDLPKLLIR